MNNPWGNSILFVGAHPDDIEMNAGGTIHKLTACGAKVQTLTLSEGINGRKCEAGAAQHHLGVTMTAFGFGEDTKLEEKKSNLITFVDGFIRLVEPTTVVTHFHADTHQDHAATYEIVIAAARNVKNVLLFKPTFPSGRTDLPFHPTYVSVLNQENMAAKMAAMKEFESQKQKYGEDLWINSLQATAVGDAWTYGGFHGYAELFQVSRLIG